MILRAVHKTLYSYSTPSVESHNEVRLMPVTDESQTCLEFRLEIAPRAKVFSYNEPGGTVHYFGIRSEHPILEISAEAVVETHLENPFSGLNLLNPDREFYELDRTRQEFAEFLTESTYVSFHDEVCLIRDRASEGSNGSAADFLRQLGKWIHENLAYDPDATHVHTKLNEVLAIKAGVCQDFAHLMIACSRSAGIPTRYVSGYLYVRQGEGMRGDQATHAWVECLMPDGRWLAIDPTNDLLANDRYISVHTGRDYSEVTPTRGVYVGTPARSLDVSVSVNKVEVASRIA